MEWCRLHAAEIHTRRHSCLGNRMWYVPTENLLTSITSEATLKHDVHSGAQATQRDARSNRESALVLGLQSFSRVCYTRSYTKTVALVARS